MRLFLSDVKRLILNPRTYLAIVGLVAVLFISLQEARTMSNWQMQEFNSYEAYENAMYGNGHVIIFLCCALPFATVFCEDLEHQYIRQSIIRHNVKGYVCSKWGVIYASAILTMMAGSAFFIVIHGTVSDSAVVNGSLKDLMEGSCYGFLYKNGHRFLYEMINAFYRGLLAGNLAVVAAMFSLFIHNKAAVLSTPVLVYQTLWKFGGHRVGPQLFQAYIISYSVRQHLLIVSSLSMTVVAFCYVIAVKRVKTLL